MNFELSNKVYDVLKWVVTLLLPALAVLYSAVASIWGLPYATQIVGTILALVTFGGVILGLSSATYAAKMAKEEATELRTFKPN